MNKLHLTIKTRSTADRSSCGEAAYAEDPSTEVICLALKKHGQDPVIWFSPGYRFPACPEWAKLPVIDDDTLRQMISEADVIETPNLFFEFFIWKYTMSRYGFVDMLPIAKLRCLEAKAVACGYSRDYVSMSSEGAARAKVLNVLREPTLDEQETDPDWYKHYFWKGTPEALVREGHCCIQDVCVEETLSNALPELDPVEQRICQIDAVINDRGFCIDAKTVEGMKACTDIERKSLVAEFERITGIDSPYKIKELINYLKSKGVNTDSINKKVISNLRNTNLPPEVLRVLEIRREYARTSTEKLPIMLAAQNKDGRIRGSFLYYGAATGRWSSRRPQVHNMPKSALGTGKRLDACIAAFNKGDLDLIRREYGDVIAASSSCLRAMIIPAPGKDFIGADFSSIENRLLAWTAGEERTLDIYRKKRDPYKVNAAQFYCVAYGTVTKAQRQVGKIAEIELGYQCGAETYQQKCAECGIELPHYKAKEIVEQWRSAHPMIKRLWWELDRCAKEAVKNPGVPAAYLDITFKCENQKLLMQIPSGRTLYYQFPEILPAETAGRQKEELWHIDNDGKKDKLYGGRLTENVIQALARDLLANAIITVEAGGYPVVLHVHDEIVAEVPEGFGSAKELCSLMCKLPPWAEELPLKATGWRGKRYLK